MQISGQGIDGGEEGWVAWGSGLVRDRNQNEGFLSEKWPILVRTHSDKYTPGQPWQSGKGNVKGNEQRAPGRNRQWSVGIGRCCESSHFSLDLVFGFQCWSNILNHHSHPCSSGRCIPTPYCHHPHHHHDQWSKWRVFLGSFLVIIIMVWRRRNRSNHHHPHDQWGKCGAMPGAFLAARFLLPQPGPVRQPHYIQHCHHHHQHHQHQLIYSLPLCKCISADLTAFVCHYERHYKTAKLGWYHSFAT